MPLPKLENEYASEDRILRVLHRPVGANRISFNCRSALLIECKLHLQLKIKLRLHRSFFFRADENCSFAHELSWKLQRETRRKAVVEKEWRGGGIRAKWLATSEELIVHLPNVRWWFSSPLSVERWNFNYSLRMDPTRQNWELAIFHHRFRGLLSEPQTDCQF